MQIREYVREDNSSLCNIAINSLDEFYDPTVFGFMHDQWPAGQLVATDFTGKPIGFLISCKLEDRQARIMLFAVDAKYRCRGIGKQLLDAFRLKAMLYGITAITLEVKPTNEVARRFYSHNGFIETMLLRNYYRDGSDGIRMDAAVQNNF